MLSPQDNILLAKEIANYTHDPYGFVLFAFRWGKDELADFSGPDTWQIELLKHLGEQLKQGHIKDAQEAVKTAISSGHGIGKFLKSDKVPTLNGFVNHDQLCVGDIIFDENGCTTKVESVQDYKNVPCYKVTFDDGSFVICSSGHLFNVRGRKERRRNLDTWHTMSAQDIYTVGVKRLNGAKPSNQWEVPSQGAVKFEDKEVKISPYLLGVWIAEGSRLKCSYTNSDNEVTEQIKLLGYNVHSNGIVHSIKGLSRSLDEYNLLDKYSHERFIPHQYLINSVDKRMELLRGLLDTDGECTKSGTVVYSTTSKQLSDDILWLARSLGCKAQIQPTMKQGKIGDTLHRACYRITITAEKSIHLFYVKRKEERRKQVECRYLKRWISDIEPHGFSDGRCIQVANKSGLYQGNDFIVTHNSALVSWIILWGMCTYPDTKGVVTANTENQLKTKTWAELAKWHRLCLCKDWFEFTATALFSKDKAHEKTWRIDMVPWSIHNTESFAGLHNKGKRILIIFDEASAIPDVIWEVTEGALTDENTEILWCCFGNPTRNTGRFRECFGKYKHRWHTKRIDSRTAKMTNKAQIEQWAQDEGEDSDFFRVRVRGEFPHAGSNQLIGSDIVQEARGKHLPDTMFRHAAIVMGVDPARFGDDSSVIYIRQGLATIIIKQYRGLDTMQLASIVVELSTQYTPDGIIVDGTGLGAGVVDRLRQMRVSNLIEAIVGSKAIHPEKYVNRRIEMWVAMAEWLKAGGSIPDDAELCDDLTSPEYHFTASQKMQLESKEHMKERGLSSPDKGDALALTFYCPVAKRGEVFANKRKQVQTKSRIWS